MVGGAIISRNGPGALSDADDVSCRTWRSRSTSGWRSSGRASRASFPVVLVEQFVAGVGQTAFSVFQMQRCRADFSAAHFAFITAIVWRGRARSSGIFAGPLSTWVGLAGVLRALPSWPAFPAWSGRSFVPKDADRSDARGAPETTRWRRVPHSCSRTAPARRRRRRGWRLARSAGDAGRRRRVRLPVHARRAEGARSAARADRRRTARCWPKARARADGPLSS